MSHKPQITSHNEDRGAQSASSAWETRQRRFLRKVICDTQLELSRFHSAHKILETTLLTAMGSLGIQNGFNARVKVNERAIQMVSRRTDNATVAFLKNKFQDLIHHYFPSQDTSSPDLQVDIHMVPRDPREGDPLTTTGIEILLGWRQGNISMGMMGLGTKIKDESFLNADIDFLYSLTDHMMLAMQAIAAKSVIHTLENELEQARERAADTTACSLAAQKDLEETRFRLSGFNDIFHELSDLKESTQVVDAFLLVLLGIFSARNGHVFYWEDPTQEVYVKTRGSRHTATGHETPAAARQILTKVFDSPHMPQLDAMQAAIVPPDQMSRLHTSAYEDHITVLFKVDDATKGMLCLGKRLVKTPYGQKERELLLTFTHNFLVFLKNSRSFETIQRLHAEQESKNIELEKTIEELTSCKSTIDGMEKAGERIKAGIAKAMARTKRVSVVDVAIIIIAGILLGLAYNFASPSGISLIPQIWRHPPARQISIINAKSLVENENAILVDARPVEFYKLRHIDGALNLPTALFDFVYMMRFSRLDAQTPIVVYGRTISRHYDETIAYQLSERGHNNVYVLSGGLKTWRGNP